jgi:sarcosine oxidase
VLNEDNVRVMKDVIVVGIGAIGSAVLYQLASHRVAAIGIDRYSPPHNMGSSHGETRITRLSVGEGDSYAPLARRSHEIWRALEASEGTRLMTCAGGLIMGPRDGAPIHHGKDAFVERTIALAERTGIAHEVLGPAEIASRYPQFALRGNEIAYFEPEAGMLVPEACVRVQLAAARSRGATIRSDEQVLSITQDTGGVSVRTNRETLRASRCIVAAGPWIGQLLGGVMAQKTAVYRQTLLVRCQRCGGLRTGPFPDIHLDARENAGGLSLWLPRNSTRHGREGGERAIRDRVGPRYGGPRRIG